VPQYHTLAKRFTPIVLGIGIPASLRSISQYIQQIIDTMYLGQYSTDSLLAISSIIVPFWMFESFWVGIMSATTVIIAQKIGAKEYFKATKVAQSIFFIALIMSIIYFIFWQNMSTVIVKLMSLKGVAGTQAELYINTVSWLYLFRFIGLGAPASILEALGKTKIIMWSTLGQSITNIILDPILIWGFGSIPELGIQGAAIATVLAEIVGMIILSSNFWRHNYLKIKTTNFFPIHWYIKKRLTFGAPITTEVMLWSSSTASIISMLNIAIPMGGAIFNVGFLLSDLCYRMLFGFDVANMSLIGRSFGAKRKDRMIATLRALTKVKVLIGLILVLFLYLLKDTIVRLFTNDPIIIQNTLDNFVWILAIALITLSVGINISTLNGMGYSRYNLYISTIGISLRILLSAWVIFYTNFGIAGVWAATIVEESSRLLIGYLVRIKVLQHYWSLWNSNK